MSRILHYVHCTYNRVIIGARERKLQKKFAKNANNTPRGNLNFQVLA